MNDNISSPYNSNSLSPFRVYSRVEILNSEINYRCVESWFELGVSEELIEGHIRAFKLATALSTEHTEGCAGVDPLALALIRRRQRRWLARMVVETGEAEFVWAAMVQYQQETRRATLQLIGGVA